MQCNMSRIDLVVCTHERSYRVCLSGGINEPPPSPTDTTGTIEVNLRILQVVKTMKLLFQNHPQRYEKLDSY